jgi:hypothetical protein
MRTLFSFFLFLSEQSYPYIFMLLKLGTLSTQYNTPTLQHYTLLTLMGGYTISGQSLILSSPKNSTVGEERHRVMCLPQTPTPNWNDKEGRTFHSE